MLQDPKRRLGGGDIQILAFLLGSDSDVYRLLRCMKHLEIQFFIIRHMLTSSIFQNNLFKMPIEQIVLIYTRYGD